MSERTTISAGTWTNVGTGPATAQVITDGAAVMFVCSATQPTGNDGLVLVGGATSVTNSHYFQLSDTIWAQPVSAANVIVAVQPE